MQTAAINSNNPSSETIIKKIMQDLPTALTDFEYLRITKEKNIPQPDPTVTIGGAAFASAGNISVISAPAKAGKTALSSTMIAGAISKGQDIDGFAEIQVIANKEGKAVIQFDTEQSEADHQYNVNTILKRAGIDKTPNYYLAYNIRQLEISKYQKITAQICEIADKEMGGVHIIVIDGGADYIESVNDEAAANKIIQYFTHLSIKYFCPVIVIVHQNPNSDKERGHFGSEIQRKCYGLVTISKDGDISTVQPKILRKAGLSEVPLIHFTFSKDKGYHVPINAPDSKAEKKSNRSIIANDIKEQEHREIMKAVFSGHRRHKYSELVLQIKIAFGDKEVRLGENKVKEFIAWYQDKGWIKKEGADRSPQVVYFTELLLV